MASGWRFNVSDVLVGNIDTENLNRRNAVKIREGCWWVDGTAASCLKTIIISAHVALAEIAPLSFVGPFYLISIMYAITQNPLCNFVAPCPGSIHTMFLKIRLNLKQFNPLIPTLKPQSNGPLYSNTVAVLVGCYICNSEEGPERAGAPPSPLVTVPNVTAHPSTASVPTSYYLMWHCNCLWTPKG